jgi:hypothetical protein
VVRYADVVIGAAVLLVGCRDAGSPTRPILDAEASDLAADRPPAPLAPIMDAATADAPTDARSADATSTDATSADTTAADTTARDAAPTDAAPVADPSLPRIHDHSGAPASRVLALVRAAVAGLGFDPARGEGPNPDDRVFVGRFYLAWLDETGFHGKLNGLWPLDGAAGDALDFVLKDAGGRPVNLFMPGENGDGRWPASYKGAEHLEFPSRTPEANDDPGCAQRDWCNQYGFNEAVPYRNGRIPWWGACNTGAEAFTARHPPTTVERIGSRLKLVYEARLVKEADGDGTFDGDACHADYLFADGVRRPVFVRLGYEFDGEAHHFDRTLQVRNPAGNPPFTGEMSFIGGFVLTGWPTPHPLKRLNRFWRPEVREVSLKWGDAAVPLRPGQWNDLGARAPVGSDVLVAWIDQPLTLSPQAAFVPGLALTLSHVGPADNRDVGACLCAVHGAIEMGGGLLHGGSHPLQDRSLPVAGGAMSIEARRRLQVAP